MAKDPAFLFYPGDWQGGTSTMSRFLKGCYLDLLIAQFNSGPLSLEEIKIVLGADFGAAWPSLQKKFEKNRAGNFFNERLAAEKSKREAYSKSRSVNRKKKDMINICNSHENHMMHHMENENRNENREIKGGMGEKREEPMSVDEKVAALKESPAWHEQTAKAFRVTTAEVARNLDDFILEMQAKEDMDRPFSDLKRHFVSWLRLRLKEKPKSQKTGFRGKDYTAGLKPKKNDG